MLNKKMWDLFLTKHLLVGSLATSALVLTVRQGAVAAAGVEAAGLGGALLGVGGVVGVIAGGVVALRLWNQQNLCDACKSPNLLPSLDSISYCCHLVCFAH